MRRPTFSGSAGKSLSTACAGKTVLEGAEGELSVGAQGWLCNGTAHSLSADDEGYRFDAAGRNAFVEKSERAGEEVRVMLQEAAAADLHDYFEFLVGEAREESDGAPEGGSRYPVEVRMDGREFARFHVDIGIGDEVLEPLGVVEGRDWLAFGGIEAPSFPVISAEQQVAEKLHAYSLPRGERANTRTKDLIDIVLLIRQEKLDKSRVKLAVGATFARRATHDVPGKLEPPPEEWAPVFAALARECSLDMSLCDGFEIVRGFVAKIREQ